MVLMIIMNSIILLVTNSTTNTFDQATLLT